MKAGKPSPFAAGDARRVTGHGRCALWAAFIILVSGMTGCTSLGEYVSNGFKVGPNYKRPPAPVADEWIDAEDRRVRSEESVDIAHWWTVFNDPVLDELVADAYRQNLTLREAGFRILQARANLGYAIGTFFPQQQYMSGDYLRAAISTEAANRPFVLDRYYNQNDLGFTLAWELDFWGRYRRAIEAADAELSASVEDYDDVMVTMLGDIATAYMNVRIYEAQIAYTKANVQLQQQTLDIAKARFKGGLVTELDVDQAQSILSQTEAQVPQLQISLRIATNQLCVLLGIPSEDLLKRMASMPIPTAPEDVAVGIPADLLRRRPDVRRAERRAAAQAARIGIAESDFYPHISINGTIGGQAAQFNDLLNSKALQGGVGPGFQWNLLNYGRILNNVRAQDALFQQLVVNYQQKVLTADREAENGLVTFLRSQEQARFMGDSVVAAQKAVVVAIAQYKGGLTDFNRVSLVEQNLVTQQNGYAQAFGAIAVGLVQTYRALGGGWEIRLDPQAAHMPGLPCPDVDGEWVPPMTIEELPAPGEPKPLPGEPQPLPGEPNQQPSPPRSAPRRPAPGAPTSQKSTRAKRQTAPTVEVVPPMQDSTQAEQFTPVPDSFPDVPRNELPEPLEPPPTRPMPPNLPADSESPDLQTAPENLPKPTAKSNWKSSVQMISIETGPATRKLDPPQPGQFHVVSSNPAPTISRPSRSTSMTSRTPSSPASRQVTSQSQSQSQLPSKLPSQMIVRAPQTEPRSAAPSTLRPVVQSARQETVPQAAEPSAPQELSSPLRPKVPSSPLRAKAPSAPGELKRLDPQTLMDSIESDGPTKADTDRGPAF